ncbi:hypothetical protein SAMN05192533_1234 [Mesobacillus persicus]|uniref:Lipoprotein n=2 Tax=Mesobacillus persicus TaxID=930146 RepID=A0A1H8JVS2_9BACI|nr:hypothetical protein SAMN05192533_1234 [Mesobacillus persicus]
MRFLLMIVSLGILLAGCGYKTLDEAIAKDLPYEVEDVLLVKEINGVSIVLYTTIPDQEEMPHIKGAVLARAYFKKNERGKWENTGGNGWEHQENNQFTVYHDYYTETDHNGTEVINIPTIIGEINNLEITRIETLSLGEEEYKQATVVEKDGRRYYLAIGQINAVKGLSEDGKVVDFQSWQIGDHPAPKE